MRYSIILPSYDPELKHQDMFLEMVKSIDINSKGQDYELIIRKNGNSYTESFNDGLFSSRGDYIVSVQDDMVIQDSEWLYKLTDPRYFVTTKINTYPDGSLCPYWALFCMPRWIYNEIGALDILFKDGVCYEDDDYIKRMTLAGIPFKESPITFKHYGGTTTDKYIIDKKEKVLKNKLAFENKWKIK